MLLYLIFFLSLFHYKVYEAIIGMGMQPFANSLSTFKFVLRVLTCV